MPRRWRWQGHVAQLAGTALAVVLCLTPATPSAQVVPLKLVSTAWTPFTNDVGQPRFALDLVEAALGRFGVTTSTTIVPPSEFTRALLGNDFDGSGAAWKDPQRESALLFSQPYLENRLMLVGRKGSDVSATSLAVLKGKRIAIVEGYSYGEIDSAGPVWVKAASEEDSLTKVLHGDADYVLMDELVVDYLLKNYPQESHSRIEMGKGPILTRSLYLAIRRSRPDSESIISRFNAQLKNMIMDRTYHRLLHEDWIRADVGDTGLEAYIPANDHVGQKPPDHVYSLVWNPRPVVETSTGGFYFGGTIYPDWASVPNKYKVDDPQNPDSRRSTASIFKFVW